MPNLADVTVTSRVPQTEEAMERAILQALIAIGSAAEGHAKDFINEKPWVDTGRLRNSITYATKLDDNGKQDNEKAKGGADKNSVYIGTNVEYAASIEYGGIHNKRPAHFLKRAVTEYTDEYKKLVEMAMKANSY